MKTTDWNGQERELTALTGEGKVRVIEMDQFATPRNDWFKEHPMTFDQCVENFRADEYLQSREWKPGGPYIPSGRWQVKEVDVQIKRGDIVIARTWVTELDGHVEIWRANWDSSG